MQLQINLQNLLKLFIFQNYMHVGGGEILVKELWGQDTNGIGNLIGI